MKFSKVYNVGIFRGEKMTFLTPLVKCQRRKRSSSISRYSNVYVFSRSSFHCYWPLVYYSFPCFSVVYNSFRSLYFFRTDVLYDLFYCVCLWFISSNISSKSSFNIISLQKLHQLLFLVSFRVVSNMSYHRSRFNILSSFPFSSRITYQVHCGYLSRSFRCRADPLKNYRTFNHYVFVVE